MSNTATPANAVPTAKQLQAIADLSVELGYDNVPEPTTRFGASRILARLIADRDATGTAPAPTSAQVRLLEKLGNERGKTYKVPTTRKQASAKIAQLLAAARKTDSAEEVAAAA